MLLIPNPLNTCKVTLSLSLYPFVWSCVVAVDRKVITIYLRLRPSLSTLHQKKPTSLRSTIKCTSVISYTSSISSSYYQLTAPAPKVLIALSRKNVCSPSSELSI
jgi:hypothetical protein